MRTVAPALFFCAVAAVAAAQQPPAPAREIASGRKYPVRVYQTIRLQGQPPVIDGRFDDAAWQEGEWSGDYRQSMPVEGGAPTQPTELKILYDDRNVYVAIRAYDEPALINVYPGRRDDFAEYAVDVVGVCFDSYNDKRTGFEFDLTAGGGKIDLVLGNGETEWDTTWDAVWDGKVAHDEKGWTAEFRVPLNQLRFGPQDEQVWGLHAWRWIARNGEEDQWQLIPRQNTGRMHQLGELRGIHGVPRLRHLELMPHVVGMAESRPALADAAQGSGAAGLDAKLGLSSNFTLDATINPDFGQVEADPSVVNLTAFETFYEEKRPFFLEGRKIFDFVIDDTDQLFYSRRIGHAPSRIPPIAPGETLRAPDSTTILSAVKVTGKTDSGLSVGILQSLTQRETADITSPSGSPFSSRRDVIEPSGSYTVARIRKDWDKGNTSLGGMFTNSHRSIDDVALEFLPANAVSGGIDFTKYLDNRKWLVEASGIVSSVSGDREAIRELQTNPVHYYQRPDATHLGVDGNRTSLAGHGGSVRGGTSDAGRLRLTDHLRWYSPGLDLNDVGYLRQADVLANQVFAGWSETRPRSAFRSYSFQLSREDMWDFGGLRTRGGTAVEASSTFTNKWNAWTRLSFDQEVDTRALRGGPALRTQDGYSLNASMSTDGARRASFSLQGGRSWSIEDDSRIAMLGTNVHLRLSKRFAISGVARHEHVRNALQYVDTVQTVDGPRYLLGEITQDTWVFTLRGDLALTPDLTVQYYGSPFISTGRYTAFKRAAETLATSYDRRFHAYAQEEISATPGRTYTVAEQEGARFSFADPDYSFRQFRSNAVLRWEYKPGSSLYAVWSQGRTGDAPYAERGFRANWDGLWRARPDNVFLVKVSYWFSL